ncbi:MAG: hypothetical protein AW07_03982 [Candidatus Accumulibacter sp. SK-11]|nr:MAG: hypothetical protein AW07_03982 [Candidatus Accumulibacter sp. SK-11]
MRPDRRSRRLASTLLSRHDKAVEIFVVGAHRQGDSKHETVVRQIIHAAVCQCRPKSPPVDRSDNDGSRTAKAIIVPAVEWD